MGVSAVVISLLCASMVLIPAPAGAQMPVVSTPLPGAMNSMVVDPATSHVFVTLRDSSEIVVLDFDGNIVKTISGEAGASGLTLVGDHVYVAAANAGAIDEIDTGTLTRTRTVANGLAGMNDIVSAAGALWVFAAGALTEVSLPDGTVTPYPSKPGSSYYGTGLIEDPADSNTIFEYDPGDSPVTISRLDVSTDPPTIAVSKWEGTSTIISNVNDIAVSPDGTHLVPSGGAPYEFHEFRTSDLNETGVVYPANPYPTAVAMTSARGGIFAGGMDGVYDRDIVVYPLDDSSQLLESHDFGDTDHTVQPGGLAFSPDGNRLFAVTTAPPYYQPTSVFNVLTITGTPPSTTTTLPKTTTTKTTQPTTTTDPPITTTGSGVTVSPPARAFGGQRVGTIPPHPLTITVTNHTSASVALTGLRIGGANPYDYFGVTNCTKSRQPRVLAAGASCSVKLFFGPLRYGPRHATLVVSDTSGSHSVALSGTGTEGYFAAGAFGEVGRFGDAVFHGDATKLHLSAPMISLATTPNGAGYWLLARDGGIFTFGNASFHGSTGAMHLNQPIVAMSATSNGKGYWLVASDGGIFTFGNAVFHGSTGAMHLNQPIVGMASTPGGKGYWLVASDGGIFAFGNAGFHGSTGGQALSAPVIQVTATPSGRGYWLLTADGHLHAFGDAHSYGSAVGQAIVGMAPTADGRGYWEISRTGSVFSYGDAHFHGALSNVNDVIGIAGTAPPLPAALLPFSTHAVATATPRAVAGAPGDTRRGELSERPS